MDWTGPPPAEVTVREGGDRPLVHYIDGVVTAPPLDVLARVREADLSGLAGDLGLYEVLADAPTPPFTRCLRYLSRLPWPWRPRAFVVEQRFERLRDGATR